jgi:hypothetical protein
MNKFVVIPAVLTLLGGVIALIFSQTVAAFERRLKALDEACDMKEPFLACMITVPLFYIVHRLIGRMCTAPRRAAGLPRPDQACLKVMAASDTKETGPTGQEVRMVIEGDAGQFNRAQRGTQNWQETRDLDVLSSLLLAFPMGYFVLILVGLQAASRYSYSRGYVLNNDARTPGFILYTVLQVIGYLLLIVYFVKGVFMD